MEKAYTLSQYSCQQSAVSRQPVSRIEYPESRPLLSVAACPVEFLPRLPHGMMLQFISIGVKLRNHYFTGVILSNNFLRASARGRLVFPIDKCHLVC
jgi:hypothetical protein